MILSPVQFSGSAGLAAATRRPWCLKGVEKLPILFNIAA
jgi:hypothetical protein